MKRFIWMLMTSSVCGDDLQPLGDEFNDAMTLANWLDIGVVEGWGTPSVQARDINTTTPGHFRIQPGALTWFGHLRGSLFFKEVTGNFIATGKFRILSRHNPADPLEVPNRAFSLSGILIHGLRSVTQAAPNPYVTNAVWPPGDYGSDYLPNTENYIFLAYGSAGNPGTRQFEIKATRNSNSRLYYSSNGVVDHEVWLQLVRVGDTVVCMRKHSEGGDWIVENRYPNPDHPFPDFGPTLQVGITAYTDWATASPFNSAGLEASYHFNYAPPTDGNPDLVSEVDYYRYQRPDGALTEGVLQGMSVSYNPATNSTANPPVLLSASVAANPYLGDAANVEVSGLTVEDVVVSEDGGMAAISVNRVGASAGAVSVGAMTSSGSATEGEDFSAVSDSLSWGDGVAGVQVLNIPILANPESEGLEQFTVTLSDLDGPANFEAGQLSRVVTVSIIETPYDQWRLDEFGGNAGNVSAAGASDFDRDTLPNLLEFVLGADPLIADISPLPRYLETTGDSEFRFTPSVNALAVTLTIESSATLQEGGWVPLAMRNAGESTWTELSAQVSVEVEAGSGEVVLTDSLPTTDPRFLRLRVTLE